MVFTMQYIKTKNVTPILGIKNFTQTTPSILDNLSPTLAESDMRDTVPGNYQVKSGDRERSKLENFLAQKPNEDRGDWSTNPRLVSLAKRRNKLLTIFLRSCQQVSEDLLHEVLEATLRDDRIFCSYGPGSKTEAKS